MGTQSDSKLRDDKLSEAGVKPGSPDTELRADDEKDSLYDDGLDVEDDSETYADTHSTKMPG